MRFGSLLLLLAVMVLFSACADTAAAVTEPPETTLETAEETQPTAYQEMIPQLIAKAENEEAAWAIAQQYGIALVRYENGLAAFYTGEDPIVVMQRRQEGWPELYLNHVSHPF